MSGLGSHRQIIQVENTTIKIKFQRIVDKFLSIFYGVGSTVAAPC